MKTDTWSLLAVACAIVYMLAYLFLPFMAVPFVNIGASAKDLLQFSAWMILPLIAGAAMVACALLAPKAASATVFGVSAFLPLMLYWLLNSQLMGIIGGIIGISLGGINVLTVGLGIVADILLGVAGVVFCLLSGTAPKIEKHSAGLTADENDW